MLDFYFDFTKLQEKHTFSEVNFTQKNSRMDAVF